MSHEAPPLASPAAAPAAEQPLVDNKLVLWWFAQSMFGMVIGPTLGLLASFKLDDPDFMRNVEWLQFGRLRIAHVNYVIFAAFTPAMFGLMCHAIPRLTGRPLVGIRAAWAAMAIFGLALAVGLPCLLLGYIQPIEAGELPMVVDALVTVVFVLMTGVVLATVAKRKEKKLYVSLWYWIAAFIWTDVNYLLGVIGLNYVAKGTTSAAMHGFYLHNVVGLWITPAGVGAAYYMLPVATRTTLFSHRLSLIGFWALAFFYPMNGVHHYIYSPIADWAQTIAIASSMMLILPVWAFCANMWGTMRGQWSRFAGPGTFVLKFTMFGAVWYLITCFQGPTEALRDMQALTHFGDYNVGHAHSAVFAVFVIWAIAAGYLCVPRAAGRELWSAKLSTWTYWFEIFGFAIMFFVLTVAGLQQGAMLQNGQVPWIDTVDALRPLWVVRTFGGTLMDVGMAFFAINMAMTAKRARAAQPMTSPSSAPAAAY
ncbi:MAG: cbb3-type cytochrome c oxidase subunit I [Planctomycetia bacterium]|nr:cbb3-type cytochrome c oxidase subunit I [Planctomycetia bacterium]